MAAIDHVLISYYHIYVHDLRLIKGNYIYTILFISETTLCTKYSIHFQDVCSPRKILNRYFYWLFLFVYLEI